MRIPCGKFLTVFLQVCKIDTMKNIDGNSERKSEMKIGFDNAKYLKIQSEHIKERIGQFGDKLYLEFGYQRKGYREE